MLEEEVAINGQQRRQQIIRYEAVKSHSREPTNAFIYTGIYGNKTSLSLFSPPFAPFRIFIYLLSSL
jgi:hypothetical protein